MLMYNDFASLAYCKKGGNIWGNFSTNDDRPLYYHTYILPPFPLEEWYHCSKLSFYVIDFLGENTQCLFCFLSMRHISFHVIRVPDLSMMMAVFLCIEKYIAYERIA